MYVCMYCIHSTKHCESTHMKRVCFGPKPQKDVGMQVGPLHHYHVRSTNDQWHPVEWKFKSYTGNDIISYLYCSKKKKKNHSGNHAVLEEGISRNCNSAKHYGLKSKPDARNHLAKESMHFNR